MIIMMTGCQPAPAPLSPTLTPIPPTSVPSPTAIATVIPPTTTISLPPLLTMTLKGNVCTLDGPMAIPYGEFAIKLVIVDQNNNECGYALLMLDEGKTIQDLITWSSVNQPEWATRLAGEHKFEDGVSTRTFDLTKMTAAYHGEPFYISCFITPTSGNRVKIGDYGPIQVQK
jgi:hypothetical protein